MDSRLLAVGGLLGVAALGRFRSGSADVDPLQVTDREQRRQLLSRWLRTMGPGWTQAWNRGRTVLSEVGDVVLPLIPTPTQVLVLLEGPKGEAVDGPRRVPQAVADAAWQGLVQSRAADYAGERFVGLARAMQLVLLDGISDRGQTRMRMYFQRHEKDKDAPGFRSAKAPSRGRMAWNNWGGDAGERWVRSRGSTNLTTSKTSRAPKKTIETKVCSTSKKTYGRIGTPDALRLTETPKLRAGELVLVLTLLPSKGRAEILDRLYTRARSLGVRRAWSRRKLPGFTALNATWWEHRLG